MKNTDKATIGAGMRPHERILIGLSEYRPLRQLGIRAADRLCERCLESGRRVNDAHKGRWRIPADELDCPGWCALLSHLEDRALPKAPDAGFDDIPF